MRYFFKRIFKYLWPGNLNVVYKGQLQSIPYCTECEEAMEDVYHECGENVGGAERSVPPNKR